MNIFLQVTAAVLLTVIMTVVLNKQNKELSVLLTLGVSCMVLVVGSSFLEPVLDFVSRVQNLGKLDTGFIEILLKVTGIGFVAEIAGLVCSDAGNAALSRALQMIAAFAVLWLSIPILNSLLELISNILGEI